MKYYTNQNELLWSQSWSWSSETMVVYASNVSRGRNHSFTHILRFLRFLNGNWHKTMVWQIQQPIAIIVCLHQSSLWLLMLSAYCIIEKESKPNRTVSRIVQMYTDFYWNKSLIFWGKKNPFLLLFCTIYKILTFCTVITSHICFSESILKKNIFIAYRSTSLCLFIKISIDVRVIPSWAGNM